MKPNQIKKFLSYITDIHIETMESDYNEELQVLLKNGRYQLCTPHAIYSYADKYDNFRDAFRLLNLDTPEIENVLLLGFGLGSIPYMLEKLFNKKYSYTGVEIDDAVIYLASKYVLDDIYSDIEMVRADAYTFIMQSNGFYDMICVDIFVDDKIPDIFLTIDFLDAVKESLSTHGILLFNHLAHHEKGIQMATDYFKNTFSSIFPYGQMMKVNKNLMMISHTSRVRT